MGNTRRSTSRARAAAAAAALIVPVLLFGYYDDVHKLVADVALKLLERSDRARVYEEVYAATNRARILDGSFMEDYGAVAGNDRSMRHYYDPATGQGVAFNPYFYLWIKFDQASVSSPGLRYPSALEWARDGAGSGDVRNWKGAIAAYDYTPASRAEAYFRLGHVVHLVGDMAEPDHATNTPHAASGYAYPRDLNKITSFLVENKDYVPLTEESVRALQAATAVNSALGKQRLGYEAFVEEFHARIFPSLPQVRINKRPLFDDYFNVMGQLSRGAIQEKGFPLPLGARLTPETTEAEQLSLNVLKAHYSFFPAIDFKDEAEANRYLGLARDLLTSAVRLNWGLLEFFHDIVDPPPYVRSVRISQGGRVRYHGYWKDDPRPVEGDHPNENKKAAGTLAAKGFHHKYSYGRIALRELVVEAPAGGSGAGGVSLLGVSSKPRGEAEGAALEAGAPAEVRIEFGPDRAGFDAPPEKMAEVTVAIGGESVAGRIVDEGTAWVGWFTPELEEGEETRELPIRIEGRDAHDHARLPGRLVVARRDELRGTGGLALDAEPELPAKVDPAPPYHIRNYEPGADLTFKVTVGRSGEPEEPAVETARAPSAGLSIGIDGDVTGPPGGRSVIWSFSLMFRADAELELDLVEKEEWSLFEGLFSSYTLYKQEGGRNWRYDTGKVSSFDRPPAKELSRREASNYDLALDTETENSVPVRVTHKIRVGGMTDPFRYKVVCRGRGPDGVTRQAEFVFDSREWVSTGRKNGWGETIYAKRGGGGAPAKAAAAPKAQPQAPGRTQAAPAPAAKPVPAAPQGAPAVTPGPTGAETPRALIDRAGELLRERDYWGATEYFRRTLDAYPMESNQGLGLCYYGAGLLEAALRHFTEAYRLDPRSRLTVLYLGTCNDKLGRGDEAVRRYEEYLALGTDDPKMAEFVRGRLQALRGR